MINSAQFFRDLHGQTERLERMQKDPSWLRLFEQWKGFPHVTPQQAFKNATDQYIDMGGI